MQVKAMDLIDKYEVRLLKDYYVSNPIPNIIYKAIAFL